MKVVMIRHSKTAGNLKGRYIGITDEPLCDEGRQLLFNKKYPQVQALYVSPLRRCRETGEILYPSLRARVVEDLRECDFGEFENKNYLELACNPHYQTWVDSGGILPFPGGESRDEFIERCKKAFSRVMEDAWKRQYSSVALIVHGGTIMSILEAYASPPKSFYDWQVKNGEGYVLEIPKGFPERAELSVLEKI